MFLLAVFYYHLGLHYSQTPIVIREFPVMFYYHLGLHYSQTLTIIKISA